eukprot:NODE_927_length_3031_cov_0.186562.p4 type:complete len:101 gc:universal NODE_927_length_3031_cov_0.186562:1673-1975(+)
MWSFKQYISCSFNCFENLMFISSMTWSMVNKNVFVLIVNKSCKALRKKCDLMYSDCLSVSSTISGLTKVSTAKASSPERDSSIGKSSRILVLSAVRCNVI